MTLAEIRRWRFYAESRLELAIDILSEMTEMRIVKSAGIGCRPSPSL
jgi:hypothetical protein